MAGYLTNYGKTQLLGNLAFNAQYLALATSLAVGTEPTLANISEVVDSNYTRQSVSWASVSGNPAVLKNATSVEFAAEDGFANNVSGINYAFLTDASTGNTLAPPTSPAVGSGTSGGSLLAGSYYWVVTAVNSRGETTGSVEITQTVSLNQKVTITWTDTPDATGFNIYRGTTSGGENVLVNSVPITPSTETYNDTGAAGTSKTPPTINSASVGNIWNVWQLTQPVNVLSGQPVRARAGSLTVE